MRTLSFVAALGVASPAFANFQVTAVRGPDQVTEGQPATIALELSGPTSVEAEIFLSLDGSQDGARAIGRGTVAPGVASVQVRLPASLTGRFRFGARLDPDGAVAEDNERDNVLVSSAPVRIRARSAELRFGAARLLTPRVRTGEPISVSVEVQNLGELAASTEVVLLLSENPAVTASDVRVAARDLTLSPGERRALTLEGPAPAGAGLRTVGLALDPELQVAEDAELDNHAVAGPITLVAPSIGLGATTIPAATVFAPYFSALAPSGGDGAHRLSLTAGRLPTGLSLGAAAIEGTPLESGRFAFTVTVESAGLTAARAYELDVRPAGLPLEIATPALERGTVSIPYHLELFAAGGEPPYVWTILGGALPLGLDLSGNGVLNGIPLESGVFMLSVEVVDAHGSKVEREYTLVVGSPSVAIESGELGPIEVGEAVDLAIGVSGGLPPHKFRALSTPPPGLSMTEDGRLQGTPEQVGTFAVRIEVEDSSTAGAKDTALVFVTVEPAGSFRISTRALPVGAVRLDYESVLRVEGGDAPFTWRIAPGDARPNGFVLEPRGEGEASREAAIKGESVRPFAHAFTVEVRDARGRRDEVALVLEIERPTISSEGGCVSLRGEAPGLGLTLLLLGLAAWTRRRPAVRAP